MPVYPQAPFDIFEDFYDFWNWTSLDSLTTTVDGTGSINAGGPWIALQSGNVAGNDTYATTGEWHEIIAVGKLTTVEFVTHYFFQNTLQTIFMHFTHSLVRPPLDVGNHIGFKIINADIYASNGDGGVQTITDTGQNIVVGYNRRRYKAILNPGVDCKFYIDDVLVITHTTNLPVAVANPSDLAVNIGITSDANATKFFWPGRVLIKKER